MASKATYSIVSGYPRSDGAAVVSLVRVSGINYTAGTPEDIEARGCGMGYITHITGGVSESGTYFAIGQAAGTSGEEIADLYWFVSSSGAEATADLSAEYVVLRVEGLEGPA